LTDKCAAILASLFTSFQIQSYTMLNWLADDPMAITQLETS